jgi:hypothetical protein
MSRADVQVVKVHKKKRPTYLQNQKPQDSDVFSLTTGDH